MAGEQAPGSILLSEKDLATLWSFGKVIFPLENICLAYRLSLICVSKSVLPVHVTSRESKESSVSCHEGSWLLLRTGSKGLFFHLRGFGWNKKKVGREREREYWPESRINIPFYARKEARECLFFLPFIESTSCWWFWVYDWVTTNLQLGGNTGKS